MTYGPTETPTACPIAFRGDGSPRLYWDCGVPANPRKELPPIPKMLLELTTAEGLTASAQFPSGKARRLVVDEGRELVLEHWATLQGASLNTSVGAHVFTEQRGDGLVVVEVVPSNGACNPQVANSWRGGIRFSKIRLRILSEGVLSTGIDLGAPGDCYLGIGSAFARRFVLYPSGDPDAQRRAIALANLADLSIPNPFPGLGAGAHVLTQRIEGRQNPLWNNVATVGPLRFDSITMNGYGQGGAQVWTIPGYEISESAARSYAADVTRIMSRGHLARVRSDNGRPIRPEEWPNHAAHYGLFDNRWSVDPWNWPGMAGSLVGMYGWNRGNASPSLQQPREVNPSTASSQARDLVLAYQPHDAAHLCRVRVVSSAAWFLCRSWAARLLIEWTANDVLSSWTTWALQAKVAAAEAAPGKGAEYARELAWMAGAVADELAVSSDFSERERMQAWRALFLRYVSASCLPNGFLRSGIGPESDNGVPWQEGLPSWASAAAWFQVALACCGISDLWIAGDSAATRAISPERLEWLLSEALLQAFDNRACPLAAGSQPRDYYGPARSPTPGALPTEAEVPVVDGTPGGSYGSGQGSGHAIHDWANLAAWRRAWTGARATKPTPEQLAVRVGWAAGMTLDQLRQAWIAKPDAWNVAAIAYLR